ncbi:hypothetical protein L0F63_000624 [Massospora cicadina]|nr:hypothetical protein L0F63_000624 [Massospora cicadina]
MNYGGSVECDCQEVCFFIKGLPLPPSLRALVVAIAMWTIHTIVLDAIAGSIPTLPEAVHRFRSHLVDHFQAWMFGYLPLRRQQLVSSWFKSGSSNQTPSSTRAQ